MKISQIECFCNTKSLLAWGFWFSIHLADLATDGWTIETQCANYSQLSYVNLKALNPMRANRGRYLYRTFSSPCCPLLKMVQFLIHEAVDEMICRQHGFRTGYNLIASPSSSWSVHISLKRVCLKVVMSTSVFVLNFSPGLRTQRSVEKHIWNVADVTV